MSCMNVILIDVLICKTAPYRHFVVSARRGASVDRWPRSFSEGRSLVTNCMFFIWIYLCGDSWTKQQMSQNLNKWKTHVKLYGWIELLKDSHGQIHEQLYLWMPLLSFFEHWSNCSSFAVGYMLANSLISTLYAWRDDTLT